MNGQNLASPTKGEQSPSVRSIQPSISYYLRKLLRENLSQLKSVVAPGAAVEADSFTDLNAVVESLYLELDEINETVRELERLALVHQSLAAQKAIYRQELLQCEEKIYWLLGFKYVAKNSPVKILVVDDNVRHLTLIARLLKKEGYEVCTTATGGEVPCVTHAFMPDLVLMDVNMPEISGYEICERLKELDYSRDIPVIFVSSEVEIDQINRSIEAGGLACIAKPFNRNNFLSGIKQLVGSREAA
ncbi:MAG: response regulator [Cyanobacteria bacterium J06648_16]